jgi:hypothetical protein
MWAAATVGGSVAMVAGISLAAAGTGAVFVVASATALGQVSPPEAGLASGIVSTFREFGAALGGGRRLQHRRDQLGRDQPGWILPRVHHRRSRRCRDALAMLAVAPGRQAAPGSTPASGNKDSSAESTSVSSPAGDGP